VWGDRVRTARRFGLVVLAMFALLSLAVAASASALQTREYTGVSFGPNGPAGGQPFVSLRSIAVDQTTGDVYAYVPTEGGTIYKFNAAGEPLAFSATGTNVIAGVGGGGGNIEYQVAIAPAGSPGGTAGDIYVANNSTVEVYSSNGEETPLGTLGENETCGVAVDPAGHVFVGSYPETILEYVPTTNPPANVPAAVGQAAVGLCNIAADGAGNVYANNFFGTEIAKLEGIGDTSPTLIEPGGTLAVDPVSDQLFVDSSGKIEEYDAAGALQLTFATEEIEGSQGIAVDHATNEVYVSSGAGRIKVFGAPVVVPDAATEAATGIEVGSATLHGTINAAGGPPASCRFQYVTQEAFERNGFEDAAGVACAPHGPFEGAATSAVTAEVSELFGGTVYDFRVVGSNENGSNPAAATKAGALSFTTAGPTVGAVTVADVSATSALLEGSIDPNGEETSFAFEYVGESQYLESGFADALSTPASPSPLGSGSQAVPLAQRLDGLDPGTTYRVRLAAVVGPSTAHGPVGIFSTFAGPEAAGRAYEMVSPAQKIGEATPPETEGNLSGACSQCLPRSRAMPMQSTPDGDALAFTGQPFFAGLASETNQYLSRRGNSGWSTRSITPSDQVLGAPGGFKALSSDLSRGVLAQGKASLSPEAPPGEGGKSFNNLYLWEAGNPALRPLITARPPHRLPGEGPEALQSSFAGANSGTQSSPAFSHVVFEANDALTPGVQDVAPPAPEVAPGLPDCEGFAGAHCNVYEWVGGGLRLVNVLPGNSAAAAGAVVGSGRSLAFGGTENASPEESQAPDIDHAVSADGSRIFWSDEEGQVYVRIDGRETVEIKDPGRFITATPDGSKVLLSDGCIYNLENLEAGHCEAELSPNPAEFLGILGASEDLSRIYFVDTAALSPGAAPGSCTTGKSESDERVENEGKIPAGRGCNLYVYDRGTVRLVTTLAASDNQFGIKITNYGDWAASPSARTAQVTPDGRYLAFMSSRRLIGGYDNRGAPGSNCGSVTGVPSPCWEVYEYDLGSKALSCASCNPSGRRPLGRSNLSLIQKTAGASFAQPQNLPASGEGTLFFESQDALTAGDTNGHIQDVYEWKPDGVGGCTRPRGCVALISGGQSTNDSYFVNATPDGNDAFFITREQLLPRDKDDQLDVYDARVGGGFAEAEAAICEGLVPCRQAAVPLPTQSSPGSTATTAGNQRYCRKGFVKKHSKCVKKPKHRKSKKHKSGHSRKKSSDKAKQHKRPAKNKKNGGSK
jgi:WD40-like Beta Propeller Repeat